MHPLMVSVSGVRGIIGKSLTPEVISRYTTAFGTLCGGGLVVVGKDTRVSGTMVEYAVYSGLLATGCTVVPIGISATPTVQLAVEQLKASGGIAITASHNPEDWNALKFFDSQGIYLDESAGQKLKDIIQYEQFHFSDYHTIGKISKPMDFTETHINTILDAELIDADLIKSKRFKVVVDCVNGAGSVILPLLLEKLGCMVTVINSEPNGIFPRQPEPLPENIKKLCETVIADGADVGFACDPDADRLAIVDSSGTPIGEEYTVVLSALFVLSHKLGTVGVNVSTTGIIDFIAQKFGVSVYRSKVGEAYVVKEMIERNCVIGGEGNGGVILPAVHYGRDAMVGSVLILQLMAELKKSLKEIVSELPHCCMTKLKAEVELNKAQAIIQNIAVQPINGKMDTMDGLKIVYSDSWVHMRLSNTEPIVRVIAEAPSKKQSDELAAKYLQYFL